MTIIGAATLTLFLFAHHHAKTYHQIPGLIKGPTAYILVAVVFPILVFAAAGLMFLKLQKQKIKLVLEQQAAEKLRTINQQLQSEIAERQRVHEALTRAGKQTENAQAKVQQTSVELEVSVERANLMAHEAAIADLAKSQFLANISHEIRTPMNAIIGFSEILAEEALTDEQTHYLKLIRESSKNLLKLINDILDFSKIEVGNLEIEIAECSLEQLLAVVESLMRPQATEKGLKFDVLQCGQLPAQIRTDRVRLRQCLINLISNAVKFTKQGHVYVNVSLQQTNGEAYIRFDVEDTGIGIPQDKHDLIFEAFMQADGAATRKFGGAGLGLALTKRLAHLLGGQLSLTSEQDRGATFSLAIPAGIDPKSTPSFNKYDLVDKLNQTLNTTRQPKFSGRVLIAEDSRANQMLISLLLEGFGLQITLAKDGKEAVDKALSQDFDLIFMDVQMPNMNGYDATTTLRENGITTPIIALTAQEMKDDDKKCTSAGCSDYLSKPTSYKKLLPIIRKYLPPQDQPAQPQVARQKS